MNYSPLRYPGGKSRITTFVENVMYKACAGCTTYIEPFAGGAGVALALLLSGRVDSVVINDIDKAIYSCWRAILEETDRFIDKIFKTPVTVEQWYKQKEIYLDDNNKYSLELGFAAFFLNRTNRSGILSNAGPIGGFDQSGKWKMDARYNREALAERIRLIACYKSKIKLYNKDILSFVSKYLGHYSENSFIYFDPPYYNQGKTLYKNFFNHENHEELSQAIARVSRPWMVTYDDVPAIDAMYRSFFRKRFTIDYSVAERTKGIELLILKERRFFPKGDDIGINIL
jgi:Site-specific DNA methylase